MYDETMIMMMMMLMMNGGVGNDRYTCGRRILLRMLKDGYFGFLRFFSSPFFVSTEKSKLSINEVLQRSTTGGEIGEKKFFYGDPYSLECKNIRCSTMDHTMHRYLIHFSCRTSLEHEQDQRRSVPITLQSKALYPTSLPHIQKHLR